jgi:hypothetical protein
LKNKGFKKNYISRRKISLKFSAKITYIKENNCPDLHNIKGKKGSFFGVKNFKKICLKNKSPST